MKPQVTAPFQPFDGRAGLGLSTYCGNAGRARDGAVARPSPPPSSPRSGGSIAGGVGVGVDVERPQTRPPPAASRTNDVDSHLHAPHTQKPDMGIGRGVCSTSKCAAIRFAEYRAGVQRQAAP